MLFFGSMRLKGRYHIVAAPQHSSQLNPIHVGLHWFTVELAVVRLNYIGLGNINQLGVHEVQESAWNIGGALRKTCRALEMPVKGKEMKSPVEV
jgi:hypothetical protein